MGIFSTLTTIANKVPNYEKYQVFSWNFLRDSLKNKAFKRHLVKVPYFWVTLPDQNDF